MNCDKTNSSANGVSKCYLGKLHRNIYFLSFVVICQQTNLHTSSLFLGGGHVKKAVGEICKLYAGIEAAV